MKIMIDTKHDSPSEIRKVIALLSHLLEDSPVHNPNIFDNSSSTIAPSSGGSVLANIFGDNTPSPAPSLSVVPETEEEIKDVPPIITY